MPRMFEKMIPDLTLIQNFAPLFIFTFLKMVHSRPLFLIFVSSIQLTVNVQYKYLLMTGFEPQSSGIGSNHYTNWATTYLYFFFFFSEKLFLQKSFEEFPNQSMGKTEIDGVDDKEEMEITDVSKLFMTTSGQSYKGSTIVKFVSRVVIWGIFKSGATLVNQVIKCQPWCTS